MEQVARPQPGRRGHHDRAEFRFGPEADFLDFCKQRNFVGLGTNRTGYSAAHPQRRVVRTYEDLRIRGDDASDAGDEV